jgi:hypothetical protein
MLPIVFISDCEPSHLIDPAAIGDEANPFLPKRAAWVDLGLWDYISDVDTGRWCGWQHVKGSGPEGMSGLMFRVLPKDSRDDAAPILSPQTEWVRASERVWFSRSSFSPAELLRYSFQSLPTHTVKLSDGQLWEVPRIRNPVVNGYMTIPEFNQSELPQRVRRTWTGEAVLEPSPQWEDLWNESFRYSESLFGSPQQITYEELLTFSLRILGLRYRYTDLFSRAYPEPLEVDSLWRIVRVACGYDVAEALLQKKRLDATPEDASL